MIVLICVGSSCHLKGSEKIVEYFKNAISENGLDNDVTLAGSFCVGKCNRVGVTIRIDDEIFTGVTPETAPEFFREHILTALKS